VTTPALQRAVGAVLTIGTGLGVALLALGVVQMAAAGTGPLDRPFPPFDAGKLVPDVIALRGQGFLWLGVLVVVVTPAARVFASLIGFALERDRRMVGVALAILAVIGLSASLGAGV
jgi:uncharacterized membrane protein